MFAEVKTNISTSISKTWVVLINPFPKWPIQVYVQFKKGLKMENFFPFKNESRRDYNFCQGDRDISQ